jgi:hypothetical protein
MMVNNNYGEQGGPNHSKTQYGSGQFGQVQTVETCSITTDIPFKDGQGTVLGYYTQNPPGLGGKLAIGMWIEDHLVGVFRVASCGTQLFGCTRSHITS